MFVYFKCFDEFFSPQFQFFPQLSNHPNFFQLFGEVLRFGFNFSDWGKKVLECVENHSIVLVSVANYKTKLPKVATFEREYTGGA